MANYDADNNLRGYGMILATTLSKALCKTSFVYKTLAQMLKQLSSILIYDKPHPFKQKW